MADRATYQAALESAQTVIAEWIATAQSKYQKPKKG